METKGDEVERGGIKGEGMEGRWNREAVTPNLLPQVVYCHQGHRLYVEAVRLHSIHKNEMPWDRHTLQPQEFCQVTNVRYLVGAPTLCSITLALVAPLPQAKDEGEGEGTSSSRNGDKERVTFSFK
jgi:hypothetical protein